MTTTTESDIKELLLEIRTNIKKVDERLQKVEIDLATIKGEVTGINKRVDDVNSHLNIMTIGFLSIVGVLVSGILGIVGKLTFFPK